MGRIIPFRDRRTPRAARVKGRDLVLLLVLGAMWGSSFLFIKVAVVEVPPTFVVAARLFFSVLTLLAAFLQATLLILASTVAGAWAKR